MVSDRTRDLFFPITILIAVAVGAVIGGSFAHSGAEVRPPINAPSADTKALVDAIDAMRAELARTREKLEMTSTSNPSSALAETRSVAPDTSEMRKATAGLMGAADSLRAAAARAGGDRAPLVLPATVDPGALQEVLNRTDEANQQAYQMWTYQQVMDRFGAPLRVGREEGGMVWMYFAKQVDVYFDFVDGRVTSVRH